MHTKLPIWQKDLGGIPPVLGLRGIDPENEKIWKTEGHGAGAVAGPPLVIEGSPDRTMIPKSASPKGIMAVGDGISMLDVTSRWIDEDIELCIWNLLDDLTMLLILDSTLTIET